MYAVIKTGGKQYKVAKDDVIKVERLDGDAGEMITIDDVLLVGEGEDVTVGAPLVDGASVAAEIVEQGRGRKIIIFKKKRRQNYRRKNGHRQHITTLKVTDILTGGAKPKATPKKKAAPKAEQAAPAADVAEAAPQQFDAAPENADDLTKISGVGPKLAETLNELGIYTFEQVAAWTPENVAFVDARLKFKGRIERDDWIGKAKELAAEKDA
ncbi:MAG: 50S ribosomal protein L21 [Pseudomonadota bacterium]